jgi:hypothetical protein
MNTPVITPDQIEVVDVYYRFLDDLEDRTVWGSIVVFNSKEETEVFDAGIESNDPEWVGLDEKTFFFVHAYLGETVEELYKGNGEFILIRKEDANV